VIASHSPVIRRKVVFLKNNAARMISNAYDNR